MVQMCIRDRREIYRFVPDPIQRLARFLDIIIRQILANDGTAHGRCGQNAELQILRHRPQYFLEVLASHPHQRRKAVGMHAAGIANASSGFIHIAKQAIAILTPVYRAGYVVANPIEGWLQLRRQCAEDASPASARR